MMNLSQNSIIHVGINMTKYGITYSEPEVYLLQESGIGTSEYAGRTAYNSFDNSEHQCIKDINSQTYIESVLSIADKEDLNNIDDSKLLTQLAWVHHHHSVLEHATLTYLVKGTSRGVLQEHARHRLQAITVQSTRYTMSDVINAFIAVVCNKRTDTMNVLKRDFSVLIHRLNILVITDVAYIKLEAEQMFDKLYYQYVTIGEADFLDISLSKDAKTSGALTLLTVEKRYAALNKAKKKRNIGDPFKHIVTDNWKVDMVVTFNLRSLKNYFDLRDSGAAYFQIEMLAKAMKAVTPDKYLDLIVKSK